ncbi:MAG TPA: NAD(P)/FAD-dependent oxidoreductase [Gemmatimonadaceae bacterium]|nr:NAD(P)/FAD-dependent oxidoreductase [Gemmatimonadaceae bacterium]
MPPDQRPARPHVVIIGGGFAGMHAARRLAGAPVDVTLVDRTNHHLFQPLLYQVATATLTPSDIAVPIRWMLRRQRAATVLLGEVDAVDLEARRVRLDGGREELTYDFLIVATGARHSYFGHDDWEPLAPGLKSLEDALEIRRRFLLSFERAEKCDDPAERRALQTFVIVGGGPTGVELAGMLPGIAREAFRDDFRRIDTRDTRVILLEGGPRLLAAFPEELSARALRDLEELRVEVRLGSVVTRIEPDAVYVGDERIATRSVFWAAGNAASPLVRTLGVPVDRAGRALVEPDLSVPGHPEVFVLGDAAAVKQPDGQLVPGVAPAAMQMGRAAADNVRRTLRGEPRQPFHYRNKGDLATIGRHKAVANFGRLRVRGTLAWLLWLFVHIMYLVGFRNRISVLLSWAYSYFTYQRGVRLITGVEGVHVLAGPAPVDRPPIPRGW